MPGDQVLTESAHLHHLCQHMRMDQGVPQAGPVADPAVRQRISSESPFADPASSSGGDVNSDQSSSEQSLVIDQQRDNGVSVSVPHGFSAPQLNCSLNSQSQSQEDYGRGSFDGQPKSSQICFDYTKGLCTRGDKCKYSHDLATIVHFNSKEKGICFDYLRNQCHRGLLCRFSHDLSNIAQQCQATEVFSNTQAGRGKTSAICYDFVKGVCQRGSDCRYSHDLSLIARTARGGQQTQKSGEICYDYLRGRCNRGTSCKYSHNISFLATPAFLSTALSSNGGNNGSSNNGNNTSSGGNGQGPPSGSGTPVLPASNSASSATLNGAAAAASAAAASSNSLGGATGLQSCTSGGIACSIIAGMAGLNTSAQQRLASSLSADPLAMGSSTSPASMHQAPLTSSLSTSISPDLEGSRHPLNTALSQDLPDMSGHHDQSGSGSSWSGRNPNLPNGVAQVQALAAAQQRQFAAAAAQLSNLQQAAHMVRAAQMAHMLPEQLKGSLPNPSGFAAASVQQQAHASLLAAAQQQAAARALMHHNEQGNGNQLHRAHSAPLTQLQLPGVGMADSLNQLLANLGENPQLLAETLSGLAAAAQAQVHAAVRMSAPGLATQGGMGLPHSAPQPIPGRYDAGSGVPSPPVGSYGHHHDHSYASGANAHMLGPAGSMPGPELLARSNSHHLASSLNAATISPDLLPLLKEIWNK